jgi:hypothetical protein
VSRRVHDVDLDPVKPHARDLGQDGDTALALQVVRVHDPIHMFFVSAENAALIEHGVDESGLAVIDVGDDGDVADFRIATFHESLLN